MIVADVMDELGDALAVIPELTGRILRYPPSRISPPQAIIAFPSEGTFDETYGRGMDRVTVPVVIVAGRVDARTSRDLIVAYCDGSGPQSVKAAIDGGTYTAMCDVRVTSFEVEPFPMGDIEYIAATFDVDVGGQGTTT